MNPGALRSLIVDGVIGGVGSVLIFLPQIMLLFLFIALLEDCGYMARAAYLMDRHHVARRPERQIVHSDVVVVCLRDSRRDGHAGDRKPPRSADDDPGRAADELQRPAAGLQRADRRLHSPPRIARRLAAPVGLDAAGDVFDRHADGRRRGAGAETHAAARADSAVRDGTAQLQMAGATAGRVAGAGTRLGILSARPAR